MAEVDALIAEAKQVIQQYLLDTNTTSIKTGQGTAYLVIDEHVRITDKQAFTNYARSTDNEHLLQITAGKRNTLAHIKESGVTPPGITIVREYNINIRKSGASS